MVGSYPDYPDSSGIIHLNTRILDEHHTHPQRVILVT